MDYCHSFCVDFVFNLETQITGLGYNGFMELKGMHTVVFGLGKTGEALVRFLLDRGARVTVTDSRPADLLKEALERTRGLPVEMKLGGHDDRVIENADLVVLSPGVPHTLACLERAEQSNTPVIGEIELACRFIDDPVVAVTGTNGKSTTTRLAARMLEHSGRSVFLGGNIGKPLVEYLNENKRADVVVIEVSSFQLDTIVHFRPDVGVLLNITPDHLDRYADFDAYAMSKARLFENQLPGDTAVLNASDPMVARVTRGIRSRRCTFNEKAPKQCSAVVSDDGIVIHMPDGTEMAIDKTMVPLMGRHNLENAASAALSALAAGGTKEGVLSGIAGFAADPHRLEFVASVDGVSYYDDSKGTNVEAAARAVEAMDGPVVLIAGGRDKFGGYEALHEPVRKHVKALIVMGEAAPSILQSLGDLVETRHAASMAEAVQIASRMARTGDSVLLSPACSSFDMYENYAARGEDFQRAVGVLERKAI